MSEIRRHLEGIRSGNIHSIYQAWQVLDQKLDFVNNKIGGARMDLVDGPTAPATPPPTPVALSVTGIDGKFLIFLTNPQNINPQSPTIMQLQLEAGVNPNPGAIVHNLQSATNISFDLAANLTDYGVSSQLAYEIQDPNTTKFFRVRSSFDGKNWNSWTIYSSAVTCGPVGVWSGLLRTPSLAMVNSAAQTVDGSNALSQWGTSTQINVASKQWNVGPQKITYSGGSTDPGAYGKYYVYAVDVQKAGGAVTYLTTQNIGDLASQDGIIIFGYITTAAGGGGTGGGGGTCHATGTAIAMFDGSERDASAIVKGDQLLGIDGGKEIAQADADPIPNVPCFSLEFSNGVKVRGVAASEPIQLAAGIFVTVFDAMTGQQFNTKLGAATLTTKTFLGNLLVWRQSLDRTKTFWADQLGSHNMKPAP